MSLDLHKYYELSTARKALARIIPQEIKIKHGIEEEISALDNLNMIDAVAEFFKSFEDKRSILVFDNIDTVLKNDKCKEELGKFLTELLKKTNKLVILISS